METRTITYRVVCTPDELIAFGRSQGWFFQMMDEKGVLKDQIEKDGWVYQEDSNTFPMTKKKQEAIDRLFGIQQAGFPILQVIYGYQVKEDKPEEPEPKTQLKLSDNTGKIFGSVALGVLAVAAGAAIVLGTAVVMAFRILDPCLIIVLDTGQDEKECPWICLSSWEE
jgi:hypothetical protein